MFDYGTISDVVITLSYLARSDDDFKNTVEQNKSSAWSALSSTRTISSSHPLAGCQPEGQILATYLTKPIDVDLLWRTMAAWIRK